MKDFRDRFEEQLLGAARRLPGSEPASGRPPAGRRRLRLPRVPRRLGLVVAALVLVGGSALATATHPWSPSLGDPRMRAGRPVIAVGSPPAAQLAILGVLRRPATAEDHGPQVRDALRYLGPMGDIGVRTDWIRRLDHSGGAAITLIPVERWRATTLKVSIRDALCVFAAEPNGDGGGKSCWSTRDVLDGHAVAGIGPRLYGLVPDGVATVEVRLADGRVEPSTVTDNFFELERPASDDPRIPMRWMWITWRDRDGRVVPKAPLPDDIDAPIAPRHG
ncbi:MAG TPA: hypothetical protein VFT50_18900 [Baekduia sp.]|nr:hypothetical protein [Baekduia sp.]